MRINTILADEFGHEAMRPDARRWLCWWLCRLPEAERTVLVERFGLLDDRPKTLAEVASIVGVSRQRVYQREQAALARLARVMGGA